MMTHDELPEYFIEQVKAALEKLYDFPALQESEMLRQFATRSESGMTGAHQLRSLLVDAIESLNPGQNVAAHSGTVRLYNIIYMHYVGRLTIQQVAWEIGVSLRQAYRDLRRGQEMVSAVLWHNLHLQTAAPKPEISVNAELTRLEDNTSVTALQDLLDTAVRPVHILADKYRVAVQTEAPSNPILLTTNPVMAQQILTHILSQIIQQSKPDRINIRLSDDPHFLRISYESGAQPTVQMEPIIRQMMSQIHWELDHNTHGEKHEIRLKSSKRRALIHVIDDNEGLIHLLQRYLADDAYNVMAVPNTEQGVQLVSQLKPDAIILDVMMPGVDGWELLQWLRTRPDTRSIPVIICSVINDPELAFALGAFHYMSKPVSREVLRAALQQLRV